MEDTVEPMQFKRDPSFLKGALIPWIVCLVSAFFYFYDFFLRVMPSVMIHPLMQEFNVGATEIGFISAFYYYAYTPLQIPSGVVVDKFSIRKILTLSCLVCVIGTFIFGGFTNLPAIFVGRTLMGIGSAFAFVSSLKLAGFWLPRKYFALFSGITTALGTIGAVSADTILSRLVIKFGWHQAVFITAYVGLALTVILYLVIRDKPKWIKHAPKAYSSWGLTISRVWQLLKNWRFWMVGIVGAFLFMPVSVFASLWGIAFIVQTYHLPNANGATMTALLFIGSGVGSPLAGYISDRIKKRRLPIFIGIIAVCLLSTILIYVPDLPYFVVCAVLFLMGFFVGPQILVFAIAREMSPPHSTGISTATTNFLVTISAAIFQPLIGYLLSLNWLGQTLNGVPIYTSREYHIALLLLPASLVVAFFMLFAVPKTHCKMLYEQPQHFMNDEH